jgi:hypothetical protein
MYELLSLTDLAGKRVQSTFNRRYTLEHMGLTNEEVEEALYLLKSEALISAIRIENNESFSI